MFWNHSKQHSSKRRLDNIGYPAGFGTIRNNTALKRYTVGQPISIGFGTIRNNTALKLRHWTT